MSMTLNPLGYAIKDKNLSQLTCLSRCLMHLAILVNSQSTYQSGVRTRVLRISEAVTHPSTNATHTVIPIFSWLTKEQAWKVECCTNGHNDLQGGFRWNSYSQGLEHCICTADRTVYKDLGYNKEFFLEGELFIISRVYTTSTFSTIAYLVAVVVLQEQ